MSAESHTVQTQYGEATIETYECDSCGNRVAYENTVEFQIGSREGRACEHCESEGPVSFPERVRDWALPSDASVDNEWNVIPYLVFAPLFCPALLLSSFIGDSDQFSNGYAVGFITAIVWLVIPAFAMIFYGP